MGLLRQFFPGGPSYFRPCSQWPHAVTLPTGGARSGGEPQGQIPGTALHLLPFGPLCHGRPSSRTACPAVRTSGPGAVSNGKPLSTSPGTYCPSGRRSRSLPAKDPLQRHFLEGTRPVVRPLGGLTATGRRPLPIPPPAFFYREPRWKRDPRNRLRTPWGRATPAFPPAAVPCAGRPRVHPKSNARRSKSAGRKRPTGAGKDAGKSGPSCRCRTCAESGR